jgi:DNA polymerase V
MFALVDCNNFYASCERVFRPDLNGKPIVVLSNNDGCVIARSNEAKAIGVPMGAPAFQNEALFTQHGVQVFSANFPLYGDMSNRVMSILGDFCPDIEVYSIDEAFLKLDGFDHYHLHEYGESMRQRVLQWTGIPISVGIAPTKALAKVANRIAKKFPKETKGIHIIDSEEKRLKALKWLQVEDVWGIGRQHTKWLQALRITTAFDFTQLSDSFVRKKMSVVGLRLKMELQGTSTLEIEDVAPKKSIATTRTFETDYTKYDQIAERITTFAASCAEKLRQQKSCCRSLMVFIITNYHRKELPQYYRNYVLQFPYATHSTIEIVHFAIEALKIIYKEGYRYKKAGVILQDFTPENAKQLTLFECRNERHIPLMKTVDQLNSRYGQQKIRLASQDLKRVWKMKQERLSPRYTTELSEVITVKV